MATTLLPILLIVHISLAVTLFLPSILLPFAFRARRRPDEPANFTVRGLLWLQSSGTLLIGGGLAITGLLLVAAFGSSLLNQPWLLAALAIYAANLVLAYFVQRPNLRSLLGIRTSASDSVWATRARRQRYVSYLMAGFVGTIGFLMSSKPAMW